MVSLVSAHAFCQPMHLRRKSFIGLLIVALSCGGVSPAAFAQGETEQSDSGDETALPDLDEAIPEFAELSEEEARQVQIMERFLTLLERTPRRGTALDRVYGHHVEYGTLDDFLTRLRERVANDPNDDAGWMLLGLIESHRGEDGTATEAFERAEALRPDDPLASYYHAQSLLLVGKPDEAVAAFERALSRQPERADLLEISQQLGRVHQRARRTEAALEVWERLESQFPDDPRVLEQIAVTLVEEGAFAEALPRYERLVEMVRDDYRKTVARIEAAGLKIRMSQREDGLKDLEALLSDLNPEGWLFREVRRRIEDIFLRSGDQDGLVEYYESWLKSQPEDVDAMTRLARFLSASGRVPEATQWLETAIERAPSRTDLHRAFINELVSQQRYERAREQYGKLSEIDPGNTEVLRDWGKLAMRDRSLNEDERRAEATRIWNQMLESRPNDALTAVQVADLFRHADLTERALELYQQAVELAPSEVQYREYLGEYYHILQRKDDAMATWQEIAAGERRNAVNLSRLAEVYNTFGYQQQAVEQMLAAVELEPKDFSYRLKAAEYLKQASEFDRAIENVDVAEDLAQTEEEREMTLMERIEILQASTRLEAVEEELAVELANSESATVEDWYRLSRYQETLRNWPDSQASIEQALKIDPNSIPALTAAARIAEYAGEPLKASELCRQLAAIDRRSRGDHLMNVARLEAEIGRIDRALQAGRDLIISAPGNTEHYSFYAQLCFRLGRVDEGLETLRKAVRINPNEPNLIMSLASALADQLRNDEAIEVYWRAFEKSETIEDQTSLTSKLTDLYLQLNQFDRLIERLERGRQEEDQRRAMTICLAQAHFTSGDYGTARAELESLLSQDTRDTELLQQLSKLCEQGHDLEASIDYQRQLARLAPGHETEFRLAQLLQQNGDFEQATDHFVQLIQQEEDPGRLLRSLDQLLSQNSVDAVVTVTSERLRQDRSNWELLYREGLAFATQDQWDEARIRFERLLDLNVPLDQLGVHAEEQLKQRQARARSSNRQGETTAIPTAPSPISATQQSSRVRQETGLDGRDYYSNSSMSGMTAVWTPSSYAIARLAAYGWLQRIADETDSTLDRIAQLEEAYAGEDPPEQVLIDWLYVQHLRNEYSSLFEISKRLAQTGDKDAKELYLQSLAYRGMPKVSTQSNQEFTLDSILRPLTDEEIDLMLECYRTTDRPNRMSSISRMLGSGPLRVMTSGSQMYIMLPNRSLMSLSGLGTDVFGIADELKRSGREEEAEELIRAEIEEAKNPLELLRAITICMQDEKRTDQIPALIERWQDAARADVAKAAAAQTGSRSRQRSSNQLSSAYDVLNRWLGRIIAEENDEQALNVLDLALRLGAEESKLRQEIAARSAAQPSRTRAISFMSWNGTTSSNGQINYPYPGTFLDTGALCILKQCYDSYKAREDLQTFLDHVTQLTEQSETNDQAFYAMLLHSVRMWEDEPQAALTALETAAQAAPRNVELQFELAGFYQMLGDANSALKLIDRIDASDQDTLEQRETMALQLAQRLGDIPRARIAAERLFGIRLSSQKQLALVSHMRQLGLHDLAEAIVSRVHRRSGNDPSSLVTLMSEYQSQGNHAMAEQIAHRLLQRTTNRTLSFVMRARSSRQSSVDANRQQALVVLGRTGGLKKLIERLEEQLKNSPESISLYEQLIEFHQADRNPKRAEELAEKALEVRPNAITLHMLLAQQKEAAGKHSDACDHYLVLLKEKPELLSNNFSRIRSIFQRAQRLSELVETVKSTNLKRFNNNPYEIINLVSELMQQQENRDLAIELALRCVDEFPQYRTQIASNIYRDELWQDPRIVELGKRMIIPDDVLARNPTQVAWYGLDDVRSYRSDGTAIGTFDRMLSGSNNTEVHNTIREAVEKRLADTPEWHAGRVMLAVMEIRGGKKKQGLESIQAIFSDDSVLKAMPSNSAWLVGQELAGDESTRDLAIQLLEHASQPNSLSSRQFEYSPARRLVRLYVDTGRSELARELMLKSIEQTPSIPGNSNYEEYQRFNTSMEVCKQLTEMGFHLDALRITRDYLNSPDRIQQAASVYGSSASQQVDRFRETVEKQFKNSLDQLSRVNPDKAIMQILEVSEDSRRAGPAIDLMLITPNSESILTQRIESPLIGMLSTAKGDNIRTQIQSLIEKHPDDVSMAIIATMYELQRAAEAQKKSDGETTSAEEQAFLEHLLRLVDSQPITGEHPPASEQWKNVDAWMAAWIVARNCLAREPLREAGRKLAEQAIGAATLKGNSNATGSILLEWGRISINTGDRDRAEELWTRLLEMVTTRPSGDARTGEHSSRSRANPVPLQDVPIRNGTSFFRPREQTFPFAAMSSLQPVAYYQDAAAAAPASDAAASTPADSPEEDAETARRIPPLSVSQFRLTMTIAEEAIRNEMPKLSLRAAREALIGGPPVPDVSSPFEASNQFPSRTIVGMLTAAPSLGTTLAASYDNKEVTNRFSVLVSLWRRQKLDPGEAYDVLKSIVLPEHRPNEILIYSSSSELINASVASLGKELVRIAKDADQLEDLEQEIRKRSDANPSDPAGPLMLSLIAIQSGNTRKAEAELDRMSKLLDLSTNPGHTAELLAHAALPALEQEGLQKPALKILNSVLLQQLSSSEYQDQSINIQELPRLFTLVNEQLGKLDDDLQIEENLRVYLDSRESVYPRYGGEYSLYIQKNDLMRLAGHAAEVGRADLALNYLGRSADLVLTENYGSNPVLSAQALDAIQKSLSKLPAEERYTTLRDWTIPAPGMGDFRVIVSTSSNSVNFFSRITKAFLSNSQSKSPVPSNLVWLVDAAQESNKIPELKALVQPALEKEIKHAKAFWSLILLREGNQDAVQELLPEVLKATKEEPTQRQRYDNEETLLRYVVWRECLQYPEFHGLAMQTFDELHSSMSSTMSVKFLIHASVEFAEALAGSSGGNAPVEPRLKHWTLTEDWDVGQNSSPAWWLTDQTSLARIGGSNSETAWLRYPITGNFEIRVRGAKAWNSSATPAYSGLTSTRQTTMGVEYTYDSVSYGYLRQHQRSDHFYDDNTIQVKDGIATYFQNGIKIHLMTVPDSFPWLSWTASTSPYAKLTDLTITGTPVIPREVKLIQGETLLGWNGQYFGDSTALHPLADPKPETNQGDTDVYSALVISVDQNGTPLKPTWFVEHGELISNPTDAMANQRPHMVEYCRPLFVGETIRYEFQWKPGEVEVHPVVGGQLMELSSSGLRVRPLPLPLQIEQDPAMQDLVKRHAAKDNSSGQPIPITLREGDWNSVECTLEDEHLAVKLNGQEAITIPRSQLSGQLFGLFHPGPVTARIRNVVLTGDWPEQLDSKLCQDLFASDQSMSEEQQRAASLVVDPRFDIVSISSLLQATRSLPDEEAFERLWKWVGPHATQGVPKTIFDWAPSGLGSDESVLEPFASHELLAPAWDLAKIAVRLNRRDELVAAAQSCNVDSYDKLQARDAFLALLAIEAQDWDTARSLIHEIGSRFEEEAPAQSDTQHRRSEFLAIWAASEHAELVNEAAGPARKLIDQARANRPFLEDLLRDSTALMAKNMRGQLRFGSNEFIQSTQWKAVPVATAALHGTGPALASPQFLPGAVRSLDGNVQVFFQSPLQGKFEIHGTRSSRGFQETFITYGMHGAQPRWDLQAVMLRTLPHGRNEISRRLDIPDFRDAVPFRIEVDGSRMETYVKDVKIDDRTFSPRPEPWVVLQPPGKGYVGFVEDLRIVGNPTIPDELKLIDSEALLGWRADFFGGISAVYTLTDTDDRNRVWFRDGNEIRGGKQITGTADFAETLITYQRPMLEDGEIEFDLYFEPGEYEAHPALGRTTILLDPQGPRRHLLTNAQYETTSLMRDNSSAIEGAATEVPMKPQDWNHVLLKLKGDDLTVFVNETEVAKLSISEPPEARTFGLFRYADKSHCRVRNVLYRGEWPKTLPPVQEQELARKNAAQVTQQGQAEQPSS